MLSYIFSILSGVFLLLALFVAGAIEADSISILQGLAAGLVSLICFWACAKTAEKLDR